MKKLKSTTKVSAKLNWHRVDEKECKKCGKCKGPVCRAQANTALDNFAETVYKVEMGLAKKLVAAERDIDEVQNCMHKGCKSPRLGTCVEHCDAWRFDMKYIEELKAKLEVMRSAFACMSEHINAKEELCDVCAEQLKAIYKIFDKEDKQKLKEISKGRR